MDLSLRHVSRILGIALFGLVAPLFVAIPAHAQQRWVAGNNPGAYAAGKTDQHIRKETKAILDHAQRTGRPLTRTDRANLDGLARAQHGNAEAAKGFRWGTPRGENGASGDDVDRLERMIEGRRLSPSAAAQLRQTFADQTKLHQPDWERLGQLANAASPSNAHRMTPERLAAMGEERVAGDRAARAAAAKRFPRAAERAAGVAKAMVRLHELTEDFTHTELLWMESNMHVKTDLAVATVKSRNKLTLVHAPQEEIGDESRGPALFLAWRRDNPGYVERGLQIVLAKDIHRRKGVSERFDVKTAELPEVNRENMESLARRYPSLAPLVDIIDFSNKERLDLWTTKQIEWKRAL